MVVRFRVAGVTVAIHSAHSTPAIQLPAALRPFATSRGADIRLAFSTDTIPRPPEADLLFDSGAVWRVYRWHQGLLYTFSTPALNPPAYKAVEIDRRFRRGILYYPHPIAGRRAGSALDFPLDELLFQHRLARDGELELHTCGIIADGRVLLFCGKSGAGKTTTARLWRRYVREAHILSDDRIVIRRRGGRPWAFGTPWHGAGGFASPAGGPIGAIFFLAHTATTTIHRLDAPGAAARLFARTFPPIWDRHAVQATLSTCSSLAETIPCYVLGFRPDRSAVKAVLERTSSKP